MAEVAGLATGAIALASLFSTCIDLFNRFELGKNYRHDYELACTKVLLLRTRIIGWGDSLNVQAPGLEDKMLRQHWPEVRDTVTRSLLGINAIFGNASLLADQYNKTSTKSGSYFSPQYSTKDYSEPICGRQHPKLRYKSWFLLRRKTVWAFHDKGKLDCLIQDLEFLVGNLEKVIERLNMTTLQKRLYNKSERPDDFKTLAQARPQPIVKQAGPMYNSYPDGEHYMKNSSWNNTLTCLNSQASQQPLDNSNKSAGQATSTRGKTTYGLMKAEGQATISLGDVGFEEGCRMPPFRDKEYKGGEAKECSAVHAGDMSNEVHAQFHNRPLKEGTLQIATQPRGSSRYEWL